MTNTDYNTLFPTTLKNLSKTLDDDDDKDMLFVFKDYDIKIKAHKIIIKAASPVLKRILSNPINKLLSKPVISITDNIKPDCFQLLIKGIYFNEVPLSSIEMAANLYYAANKFQVEDVRKIALKYMMENVNYYSGSSYFVLSKAIIFNLPELEKKAKDVFAKDTYMILSIWIANGYPLNDNLLSELFSLDNLSILFEFDLYVALETIVLSGFITSHCITLSTIRFLTMNTRAILNCDLLTHADKCAIIEKKTALEDRLPATISMPPSYSSNFKMRNMAEINDKIRNSRLVFWILILMKGRDFEKNLVRVHQFVVIPASKKELFRLHVERAKNEPLMGATSEATQYLQRAMGIVKQIFPEMNVGQK